MLGKVACSLIFVPATVAGMLSYHSSKMNELKNDHQDELNNLEIDYVTVGKSKITSTWKGGIMRNVDRENIFAQSDEIKRAFEKTCHLCDSFEYVVKLNKGGTKFLSTTMTSKELMDYLKENENNYNTIIKEGRYYEPRYFIVSDDKCQKQIENNMSFIINYEKDADKINLYNVYQLRAFLEKYKTTYSSFEVKPNKFIKDSPTDNSYKINTVYCHHSFFGKSYYYSLNGKKRIYFTDDNLIAEFDAIYEMENS